MAEYHCTLSKKFDPSKHDVVGWSCSEKLDGVRAIYCPERKGFFSRSNKPLHVPDDWLLHFRHVHVKLDGEFFMGRGRFQETVSAVRKKAPTDADFEGVQYVVFDSFSEGPHPKRLLLAHAALSKVSPNISYVLRHFRVDDMEDAEKMYSAILRKGGEGLMFRNPEAGYEMKRTGNLLKWKDEIDGTAIVTGMDPGEGKHEGRMGALVCVCDDTSVTFRVGTGFSDEEREEWWEWWEWGLQDQPRRIRWRAMERTRDNIPRHPAYYGIYEGE